MPPPTNRSMSSVLLLQIDLMAESLLPGADRDLHVQNVDLMQISGCWKIKVTHGDNLCR